MLQMLLKYHNGTHLADKDAGKIIIYKRTDRFVLYPSEEMHVSIDGEVAPFEGGDFSVAHNAVKIVIPEGSALLAVAGLVVVYAAAHLLACAVSTEAAAVSVTKRNVLELLQVKE